jgi:hypothetical protein
MPISTNALLSGLRGSIGKQLVIRQRNGKTIVSAFPEFDKKKKRTPAQKRMNERFAAAHAYAKNIIADATARDKAQVRLNVQRNRLYNSLISEYCKMQNET